MGLNMYLRKEIYIGANYNHNGITGVIDIQKNGEKIPIKLNEVNAIRCEAIYWRKANQIHKWFVDNVQDGEDDCGEYEVSKEKLKELYDLCCEVLDKAEVERGVITVGTRYENGEAIPMTEEGNVITNAEELSLILPTASGFFFGSTNYDQYYLEDIRYTKERLEELLNDTQPNVHYNYRSSW